MDRTLPKKIFEKNFKEILDLNKQAFKKYVDQMLPNLSLNPTWGPNSFIYFLQRGSLISPTTMHSPLLFHVVIECPLKQKKGFDSPYLDNLI